MRFVLLPVAASRDERTIDSASRATSDGLAEYRERVRSDMETGRLLRELLEQDDLRRADALAATRPILSQMTSAELLDALHGCYRPDDCVLPCDDNDVLPALLDELDRRRAATAHERMRLRARDRER